MGRSANKLSRTRSAVVSLTGSFSFLFLTPCPLCPLLSVFFALIPLSSSLYLFPSFAPPPPLALLHRQPRILRLRHCRLKRIQHTNIRILLRNLPNAANPQQLKIPQHRRPDRNQIFQLPLF